MPDQTTPATEAEVASETTPRVDDQQAAWLSRRPRYLDKDRVTRAQAEAYRELLTSGDPPGTPWRTSSLACRHRGRDCLRGQERRPPRRSSAIACGCAYSDLKPSHQWLKAVIATAVALHQEMQEEGEEPDSK
jgi:hypothetical protein